MLKSIPCAATACSKSIPRGSSRWSPSSLFSAIWAVYTAPASASTPEVSLVRISPRRATAAHFCLSEGAPVRISPLADSQATGLKGLTSYAAAYLSSMTSHKPPQEGDLGAYTMHISPCRRRTKSSPTPCSARGWASFAIPLPGGLCQVIEFGISLRHHELARSVSDPPHVEV